MKTKITIIFILALCLSSAVLAQYSQDRARLRSALEKTDEVLTRAREAVFESGSERAKNQLEIAARLQNMARSMYDAAVFNDEEQILRSAKYTLSAREKAQRAIAITRQAEENEDYVRRRLEKTDELIRRLEDEAGNEVPAGLRSLLDSARDKQQRAVELFRNRRLKASLQLTLQVEKSLKKVAEQVGGYRRAMNRYQAQVDRYFSLRERIELSGYGDRPEIMNGLKNAERFQNRAEDYALEGRYGKAEREMSQAVETLSRLAEDLREPAKIKSALEGLTHQMEVIGEKINQYGDESDRRQYQNAAEHLEKARAAYGDSDFEGAAAQLQAARQLLARLAEKLGKSAKVDDILGNLMGKVEQLAEKVAASDNEQAKTEFASAREILSRAASLYRSQDLEAAQTQLELAYHKLSWIERTLGE
jgi:hypothetical protein